MLWPETYFKIMQTLKKFAWTYNCQMQMSYIYASQCDGDLRFEPRARLLQCAKLRSHYRGLLVTHCYIKLSYIAYDRKMWVFQIFIINCHQNDHWILCIQVTNQSCLMEVFQNKASWQQGFTSLHCWPHMLSIHQWDLPSSQGGI